MTQVASILYIDDDSDDHAIFIEALKEIRPSFLCHIAFNGVDALALLRTVNPLPVCIYLDINMPKMDGLTTLQKLKSDPALSHIPVFMLSTSKSASHEIEARRLGAADFLIKPNTYHEFGKILSACLIAHIKAL